MKNLKRLYLPLFGLFGLLTGHAQTLCDSRPVDIVFAVDVTSSMRGALKALPLHFTRMTEQFSTSDLRTGGLVFRDYGEKFVFQTSPLSNETLTTLNFLTSFQAVGGGDDPEPLNETLLQLRQFSWRAGAVKLVILLSDAPARDPNQTEAITHLLLADQIRVMVLAPKRTKAATIAWQEQVSESTGGLALRWEDDDWCGAVKYQACPPADEAPSVEVQSAISISPNPARHTTTISSREALGEVMVFDSRGQAYYTHSVIATASWTLDLAGWPPGVYWVRTNAGVGKLVVVSD